MALLIAYLASNLGPFGEVGGSNSKIRSKGKLGNNEDLENELRKEPEKEHPSSSAITPS